MRKDDVFAVSSNTNFKSNGFPKYIIGEDNRIVEPREDPQVPSLKEIVAKETEQMLELHQRVSVRDLAKKFEKGLDTATKLSDEAKWREVASLDRNLLLKKLRDLLETMRVRRAGRNKDDLEEAISMVEALGVQLTQREGELLYEKAEVKKQAAFLKKASEDAKKVVEEERVRARAEIESARAAMQRVEKAFYEQDNISSTAKQDLEQLTKEVQEARRIKMLHQPSRVMDMENELRAMRILLVEKSMRCIQLQKELAINTRKVKSQSYELEGLESLGSCLHISRADSAPDLSSCSIQWYRIQPEENKKELISGATKPVYAPEPYDVGRILQAEVISSGERVTVTTNGPIDPAAGLGSYVEALVRKPETTFNVVIVQKNGNDYESDLVHVFHIGKLRLKLSKGRTAKAKNYYSTSMQLCGVRGGGNAAAQSIFWQVQKGLSFSLAFESDRERNAAIMLARRFAIDCNVVLAGPGDRAPVGT